MASSTKNRYKLMLNPNTYSRITCAAYGCDMRSGTNALSEIKMFQFPRDPYRRRRWELATRRANWKANSKSRLCCKHFITGKPSKDPKHPDYVPSVFVFSKNAQNLKKSFSKIQKKLISSAAESSATLTTLDCTTSHEGSCIASSCGKGFCATCFSPESVSSAFNMSLAPLNQTLTELMAKLKEMEEEREQLRSELARCREEVQQLREVHQHCEVQSQSINKHSKPNSFLSDPSSTSENVTEILESMYSGEAADIDDPDSFPSIYMEENSLQASDKSSNSKRKKRVKGSNLKSKSTSESTKRIKSSDTGSPITIVYLKR